MNTANDSLEKLYKIYPILKIINNSNNNIVSKNIKFKYLNDGENMSSLKGQCEGIPFVLSGRITIQRVNEEGMEMKLYDIESGALCHEAFSCLLSLEPLNIIGTAVQKSYICIVPIDIVKDYLICDGIFLQYVYKDLYQKLNVVLEKREEKIHDSVETRLIRVLKNKASRIVYATHKELALEIDSRREVISRKLKALEKQGYLKLERGKILILKDLENL